MGSTKSYIAYLDLLGIKAVASFDYESYFDHVVAFQEEILNCQQNNLRQKRNKIHVYMFSDCAYLESKDLFALCSFVNNLRMSLLRNNKFFNAAITEGSLGANIIEENTVHGTIFQNKDTVKVCTLQTTFGGVGIRIDESIIEKTPNDSKLNSIIAKSCFCCWNEKEKCYTNFIPFYDIKFNEANADILLVIMVNEFLKTAYIDKRAARYYFSGMKTCISQMALSNTCEFIDKLVKYKLQKSMLKCLSPLYYLLVNSIYDLIYHNSIKDKQFDLEDEYDLSLSIKINDVSIKEYLEKLTSFFFINGFSDNLDEVSNCLISNRNKYIMSIFLVNDVKSDFTDFT